MLTISIISIILFLIPLMIFLINNILSMKLKKDREKLSSFECGFDQMTPPQLPFSIQFFLISLMFLIFDIEIILILPILSLLNNLSSSSILTFLLFIIILIVSLWYEWSLNYLNWI
uniref:NADH-ubiquinone oxidoreductase chain 3 n=1 Tax=Nomia chalybeata TaxID=2448184 RepID=A0A7L8EYQ0_9HYME|nr:NADH dehydrogenase subunit 3 [Nomia chalybeata]QOE17505.1 NADH dehydrogenase subunit 3 [Nomia chalybeata]